MTPLTMALIEKAIAMTNLVSRDLQLEALDFASVRASIFQQILNDLVYGPTSTEDTDGKENIAV